MNCFTTNLELNHRMPIIFPLIKTTLYAAAIKRTLKSRICVKSRGKQAEDPDPPDSDIFLDKDLDPVFSLKGQFCNFKMINSVFHRVLTRKSISSGNSYKKIFFLIYIYNDWFNWYTRSDLFSFERLQKKIQILSPDGDSLCVCFRN